MVKTTYNISSVELLTDMCRQRLIDKNKLPKLFRTFVIFSLILANDIHPNPGPIQYPCGICGRSVNSNHRAISCDNCEHWGDVTP
jgi:Zn finger protein HypA/HybF involved in hydrogenase expression